MPARQRRLDPRLRGAQPVEGRVELLGGDRAELERRPERVARGRRIQRPGGGELGRGVEESRHDQRQGQPPPALRAARQQPLQPDLPRRPQRRQHVPVGQRTHDLQPRARRHQRLAAQHRPQRLDLGGRPLAQIGERAVPDLGAVAKALPQQDRGRRTTVRHDGDVHAQIRPYNLTLVKQKHHIIMTTEQIERRATSAT